MTTMYPEFPVMKYWNKLALKTIMQHIETEIMSDGFQFERASHYYKLDIMNYFRIFKIAQNNDVSLPEPYMERFNKMFEAFVNLSLPSKRLPVLQDAQDKYKAQKILNEGYLLLPESPAIYRLLVVSALLQNDTLTANQYASQFKSLYRKYGNYFPESWRMAQVGKMYLEAGQHQKAEELFQQALKIRLDLRPEDDEGNPGNNLYWYYHLLGDLLIRDNQRLDEGIDFLQKAMVLSKEAYGDHHPFVLHSLGSGY